MGDGTTAHGMAHSSGMDMDAMNQRMQKMRDLMKKAHSTQDMQKRHELMREHMSEMRKMMKMMKMTQGSGMMGKSGVSKNKPMQMGCDEKHGMMDHEMMANRLHMMEKMMGQMIDQQSLMLEK